MNVSLVLTVICDDRPGIVERLSETLSAHDGSWVESGMVSMAGKFAGVLYAVVPDGSQEQAIDAFKALAGEGMNIQVEATSEAASHYVKGVNLELVGQDRPGIIRDISKVLASFDVNVDELATCITDASMSGEHLFNANVHLKIPQGCDLEALQHALEDLADELMVDIELSE